MTGVVHTNTHFLKRDELYNTEKPYSLRFTPSAGFPRSNIKLDKHDIDIHDIRGSQRSFNFEKDGIAILDFESKMLYEDYDDDAAVREVLLKEIANALKSFLGAQHVQIFEHIVCRLWAFDIPVVVILFARSSFNILQGPKTARNIPHLDR